MADAHDRNLKYGENRYGFHLSSAEQKAGVSPEFVHSQIVERVRNLESKTEKAHSLRVDDPDYLFAVRLLGQCSKLVQNSLDNKIASQPDSENIESSNNSYSPRRF